MKLLLVFRGEIFRKKGDRNFYCNKGCLVNNLKKIIQPLKKEHEVDIILSTYDKPENIQCLEDYKNFYQPKATFLYPYNSDINTCNQPIFFIQLLKSITELVPNYDRVLIFRYDIVYKKNILSWEDLWKEKKGVFFLFKDESEEQYRRWLFSCDIFHSIDREYFEEFLKLITESWEHSGHKPHSWDHWYTLHWVSKILHGYQKIPFFYVDGENSYWQSNTNSNQHDHPPNKKNPYYINYCLDYGFNDYHLTL